jgi:chorismate synthase
MSTLRLSTAGESHGPAEVCILDGIPAGLRLETSDIDLDLARRQQGYGRGGRMAIETDRARLLAGVRLGRTLGTPIAIMVENRDHMNWQVLMSPDPIDGLQSDGPGARVTVPRPGHADLAGVGKYGFDDVRDVLERASARETVARVAAGAVCRRLLAEFGVSVRGRVVGIGPVCDPTAGSIDGCFDPESIDWEAVERSPVACADSAVAAEMCAAIDAARAAGSSLGGVFEIWCWGVCPGLGGYARIEDRLDGRLLGALGSIPAIKGVEVGHGFRNATLPGRQVHDATYIQETDGRSWVTRRTNRAGGLEGGMSTGMSLILRAAMKPIPTLTDPLPAVDVSTITEVEAHVERSDISAVPAARVVGEAMVAFVVAQAYREKFGGDSLDQMKNAVAAYEHELEVRGLWRRW